VLRISPTNSGWQVRQADKRLERIADNLMAQQVGGFFIGHDNRALSIGEDGGLVREAREVAECLCGYLHGGAEYKGGFVEFTLFSHSGWRVELIYLTS